VIVTFQFDFLCQRAQNDQQLEDTLENGLDRLIGRVPRLIFMPQEQWPQIRQDYLNGQKAGKKGTADHAEKENGQAKKSSTPKKAEADPVVDEALKLFGDEIVDIKND